MKFWRLIKLNKIKTTKLRKNRWIVLGTGLILTIVLGYYINSALGATIDLLAPDGSMDTSYVNNWSLAYTGLTSTLSSATTNKVEGDGSAQITTTYGVKSNFTIDLYHNFTPSKLPDTSQPNPVLLNFSYLQAVGTSLSSAPTVTVEIWKPGGTSALQSIPITYTAADGNWQTFNNINISAITELTTYEIHFKISGKTGVGGSKFSFNFDGVSMQEIEDTTPPQVASASAGATDKTLNVVFNEPVDSTSATNPANYSISPSLGNITSAVLLGDKKTVQLQTANSQTWNNNYTVTVNNVKDISQIQMTNPSSATFAGTDSTPPTVSSNEVIDATHVNVTFSEPMDKTSAEITTNYLSPTLTVRGAVLQPDGVTVQLTTDPQTPRTSYTITIYNVKDLSTLNTVASNSTITFTGYREYIPPKVTSASSTDNTNTSVTVNFSETVQATNGTDSFSALNLNNYTIKETNNPANILPVSAVTQVSGTNGTSYIFTTAKQKDGVSYTVTVQNVQDLSGNAIVNDGVSNTADFIGQDSTPPTISNLTVPYYTMVKVVFNERVDQTSADAKSNYTITGGTGLSVNSASLEGDGRTVDLVTPIQKAGTVYTLTVVDVKDLNNNAIMAPGITANFTGSSVTPRSPHANYSTDTTSCADCHTSHNGGVTKFIKINEKTTCLACHNQGGTSGLEATHMTSAETYTHTYDTTKLNSSKTASCSGCHDPHKEATTTLPNLLWSPYTSKTASADPTANFTLCYDCHSSTPASRPTAAQSTDIKKYYSKQSNNGAGTEGQDMGHYIKSSNKYKFTDGVVMPAGTMLNCSDCHDRHGSKNKKMLKNFLGVAPTGGSLTEVVLTSGSNWTTADERAFCMGCHNGTTRLYNPSDPPITWNANASTGHTDSSASCTGCHGGKDGSAANAAHSPNVPTVFDPESKGNQDCASCHGPITSHSGVQQNADGTGFYRHVSDNNGNLIAYDGTQYQNNSNCLFCHVDHDLFRPSLDPNNKRANNLRQFWGDTPGSSSTGYTPMGADFIGALIDPQYNQKGGICISCHYTSQTRRYANANPSTVIGLSMGVTPTAQDAASKYDASAHNYNATSTYKDNTTSTSTFNANCVKCHNDNDSLRTTQTYQTSTNKFGAHASDYQSILTPFADATLTNPLEQNLCFKCHNISGEAYGAATWMTARAKGIQDMFAKTYGHPITTTAGIHKATESTSPGWNSGSNRHVECDDCHNSHQTKAGTTLDSKGSTWGADNTPHTADDTVSGAIFGIWGVDVSNFNSGTLGQPGTPIYTYKPAVAKQYELCLKCHSDYSWNNGTTSNPPASKHPAAGKTVGPFTFKSTQPEIGQQFNPNNYATHALFAPGRNQPPANLNANWSGGAATGQKKNNYNDPFNTNDNTTLTTNPNTGLDNTFVDGWGTQSLTVCTDCHSTDNGNGDANVPDGPHGSTVKWILRKADPRITVTLADGTVKTPNSGINGTNITDPIGLQAAQNNLCLNCHRADVYGWGTRSASSVITFANLSRFRHSTNAGCMGPDGDKASTGNTIKNDNGGALPGCLNCHGGLEPGGMHGSSLGKGAGYAGATSELGKRFSNGASWSPGHALGDSSGSGACWNASVTGVNSCAKHTTSGGQGFTPNYYYPWQ